MYFYSPVTARQVRWGMMAHKSLSLNRSHEHEREHNWVADRFDEGAKSSLGSDGSQKPKSQQVTWAWKRTQLSGR